MSDVTMSSSFQLPGLTAAAFTPLHPDQSLDLDRIPGVVDHLESDGITALYVLGSTGEGVSLSSPERRAVAEAYVEVARGRLPVAIQVGHDSLLEAGGLAEHAQNIGADAISAAPPSYFKPESTEVVIACLAEIAARAPELPFYYYHVPVMTGVHLDMNEFLRLGAERVPTLVGVKYSDPRLHDFQVCQESIRAGGFDFVFGVDEMLMAGMAAGMRGAVGSTYNFAAPLYLRIIEAFERGDLAQAREDQARAAEMVDVIVRTCGRSGLKAMMGVIGLDCGPPRLPQEMARAEDVEKMTESLDAIGFFEWGRGGDPPSGGIDG